MPPIPWANESAERGELVSRGLSILATAAVTGSAFAAAVTLPTLVTLGSDAPPESLALPPAAGNRPVTVVKAAPLVSPPGHKRGKRSRGGAGSGAPFTGGGPALGAISQPSGSSR